LGHVNGENLMSAGFCDVIGSIGEIIAIAITVAINCFSHEQAI
jgi:hypothetical protein